MNYKSRPPVGVWPFSWSRATMTATEGDWLRDSVNRRASLGLEE